MVDISNSLFSDGEIADGAANPESALPPAGHERREELKRRTDDLEQQADEKYADVGKIPEDALAPDREIQSHIRKSHLEIGTDHPYLKTKWVNYVNQNGSMVWQAKSEGWSVASVVEFPEAADLKREDGTIRVGDVLLMCIRIDQYLLNEKRAEAKRLRQQYGVEAEIHDLAANVNRAEGKEVFGQISTPEVTGVNEDLLNTIEQRASRQQSARRTALRHIGNKMKGGTLPGVPIR